MAIWSFVIAHCHCRSCADERVGLIEDMFGVTTSDDYRPVTWMGRYPVDVTTLIVGIHVLCAILGALLAAAGHGVLSYAMFDSALVAQPFEPVQFVWANPASALGMLLKHMDVLSAHTHNSPLQSI